MNEKRGYVYIMTNKSNRALYTGVTSDLVKRIWQHKEKQGKSFTKKYNIDKLVYYEIYDEIVTAIEREKQIKAGSRQKKIDLIEQDNPSYIDLYSKIIQM